MLANKALSAAPSAVPVFIEDTFSSYLYTGNGSTQTITNNIDLSGKGGLTWIKKRNAAEDHVLTDTVRGAGNTLFSNLTDANEYDITRVSGFTSSGFSVGGSSRVNQSANTYASWTFREQAKFFDVVTYTGNGSARTISHNLGSVPGCIIVKSTSNSEWWAVQHRSLGATKTLYLNSTNAEETNATNWNNTAPTSTVFTVGTNTPTNASGQTYVAYLFAHDAGGFGTAGTDNVISCGSFNYSTFPQTVTLGYEPQWLLVKQTDDVGNWIMYDNMRGFTAISGGGIGKQLLANTSASEGNNDGLYYGGATGFNLNLPNYGNYIYIAIRRGPMKTPTSGTSVFSPNLGVSSANPQTITTNFPVDFTINTQKNGVTGKFASSRLQGKSQYLTTTTTNAEADGSPSYIGFDNNTAIVDSAWWNTTNSVWWNFRRAPGFFDEVCWTSTGTDTVSHNLAVVPELIIRKRRNSATAGSWNVYAAPLGASKYLILEQTAAEDTSTSNWQNTTPTASVFYSGNTINTGTYVAYLFASLTGISKVGSYTGNGSSQTINCGFTAGARFILIKRTDSTGDWYVYDSARGIVSGNDPQLKLNSTAAEATGYDAIDPDNSGFIVNNDATNFPINVNNATYIYLAIA